MAKRSSSSGAIRKVLCELALGEADLDSGLTELLHIPGLSNKWLDALSWLWEPAPKKFPQELAAIERTHVPPRTLQQFRLSLRAAGVVSPPAVPISDNRRVP